MLQHMNNVFFKPAVIDRKEHGVPTVYLDVRDRHTRKLIGELRFNHDPKYSKKNTRIRMAFDVFDPNDLDPSRTTFLEDIIIGGLVWITMDNHYTYPFIPEPYMVVHDYQEDTELMSIINMKTRCILEDLKCEHDPADANMFIFKTDKISKYLSDKLAAGR